MLNPESGQFCDRRTEPGDGAVTVNKKTVSICNQADKSPNESTACACDAPRSACVYDTHTKKTAFSGCADQ